MEPVTQGILGACFACLFVKKKKIRFDSKYNSDLKLASITGLTGGIAPDIDVFFRSESDPLFFIEFHRHFTHSLIFVPFGALLVSIFLFLLFKGKKSFKKIYFYSTLGFLSHGILDACTTYGTSTFWPFSDYRVSLNIISIVDPIYTFILLIFLIISLKTKLLLFVRFGFVLSLAYLFYGFVTHEQIKSFIHETASRRGHEVVRVFTKPTFGNNFLWRSIYQTDEFYFIDAVYKPFLKKAILKNGTKIKVIDKERVFSELSFDSKQRDDIKRFSFFCNDFIFIHPDYNNLIADLRYGTLPNDHRSLWGIEIDVDNESDHVNFRRLRSFSKKDYKEFWSMLTGKGY